MVKIFIHVSKGIEPGTFKRISEMIDESIDSKINGGIAVLSGPSHAEEVAIKHPTTVSVSSENEEVARLAQDLFMTDYFRVYTNNDLVGIEIGGALKISLHLLLVLLTELDMVTTRKQHL